MSHDLNLDCPICLEIFSDPTTLMCGHSFCTSCITETVKALKSEICPLCKKPIIEDIEDLNPNIVLKNLSYMAWMNHLKQAEVSEVSKHQNTENDSKSISNEHISFDFTYVKYETYTQGMTKQMVSIMKSMSSHKWTQLYTLVYRHKYHKFENPTNPIQESHKHIYELLMEYIKFMAIKIAANDCIVSNKDDKYILGLSVPEEIDNVWHLHLLIPRDYFNFCNIIGRMIEHNPLTSENDWSRRYKETYDAYKRFLGRDPPSCIWKVPCSKEYPCVVCKNGSTMYDKDYKSKNYIFVKTLMTTKTITLSDIDFDERVEVLKWRFYLENGTPPCLQNLIFANNLLEEGRKLSYYDLKKESTIYLSLKLGGC